jgi:hypothetical protein
LKLQELIKIDFYNFPLSECVTIGTQVNSTKNTVTSYQTFLKEKEMGLFDTLIIRTFDNKNKNYSLETKDKPLEVIDKIELLVNDLHKIYGNDYFGNGVFTEKDFQCFTLDTYWKGRHYSEPTVHKPVCMLSYEKRYGLSLLIWPLI